MAWRSITTDDVLQTLAGAEMTALQTAAKASGQSDPLPGVIADIVNEVRGYIAAGQFDLGPDGTVPDQLRRATLIMIRTAAASRLPVKSFSTPQREKEQEESLQRVRDAAKRLFMVESPLTQGSEKIGGATVQLVRPGRTVPDVNSLL